MRADDFEYELPQSLIAQYPLDQRGASRLLCLNGKSGKAEDRRFSDLPGLLKAGDLLVLNDTRVIPARLYGRKETGGACELLIERVTGEHEALAHVRSSKSPRAGSRILLGGFAATVTGRDDDLFRLEFDAAVDDVLKQVGHIPLPPYIDRPDETADGERYQTVYASEPGAVAAPTAGLHFDDDMLAKLERMGINQARLTLHVGAGTFQPVRCDNPERHRMHSERFEVSQEVCDAIAATRDRGGRVVAVGTTVVRSLESASRDGRLEPVSGDTDLFIFPGYRFEVVDLMLTNFHLPRSTLLMLVCAFAGHDAVLAAYRHAVGQNYRFFSYGDAMFVSPAAGARNAV